MKRSTASDFEKNYELHVKHLKLKGLQPKTIDGYSRAIRRVGEYFNYKIDNLSYAQMTEYFTELFTTHSWSTVKIDLYGLQFYYKHVLQKAWIAPGLIKPPKVKRLPDILTVVDVERIIQSTQVLSYRVFFFTLYSLGLRLGEGLRLQVGDIDAAHGRVHVRDAKGNKDRFVPLPHNTLNVLRRFWQVHRHPQLLFPNRYGGLKGASLANSPLDRGGVQKAMRKVIESCGIKKRLRLIVFATATQPI